jgi:predicted nucleotidyltransferase
MIITGISTEYNPFHNGHLYHLAQARKISRSDGVICIMSGNFVQRGRPALLDKWARTKMALKNGVDLILELPLIYSIRSAEYFALGAIQLLTATGIVNYLVFGSELGKIEPFLALARVLNKEKPYFKKRLKIHLQTGLSYPKARENALFDYLSREVKEFPLDEEEIRQIIASPNNILGLEYIKSLEQIKSSIKPLTIQRIKSSYHSEELSGTMASATAIRKKITEEELTAIKKFIPEKSWKILQEEISLGKAPINEDCLGTLILARLRQIKREELLSYAEIENGLENRIIEAAHKNGTLFQLISHIKTRAFTWTRIQRNLLHILFGLDDSAFQFFDEKGPSYLRVLGFNQQGEKIMTSLMKHSRLPVIIQPANFLTDIDLKNNDPLIRSLSYDLLASDLYCLLRPDPAQRSGHLDFTTPLVRP